MEAHERNCGNNMHMPRFGYVLSSYSVVPYSMNTPVWECLTERPLLQPTSATFSQARACPFPFPAQLFALIFTRICVLCGKFACSGRPLSASVLRKRGPGPSCPCSLAPSLPFRTFLPSPYYTLFLGCSTRPRQCRSVVVLVLSPFVRAAPCAPPHPRLACLLLVFIYTRK